MFFVLWCVIICVSLYPCYYYSIMMIVMNRFPTIYILLFIVWSYIFTRNIDSLMLLNLFLTTYPPPLLFQMYPFPTWHYSCGAFLTFTLTYHKINIKNIFIKKYRLWSEVIIRETTKISLSWMNSKIKKCGSSEEDEVSGFFVLSHLWMRGYLGWVRLSKG